MRCNTALVLFTFLLSCSNIGRQLEEKEQTLTLQYIAWACACANWAGRDDMNTCQDQDSLAAHCVFVEPAMSSLQLPDTIGYSGDAIQFTGRFYKGKGFPSDYVDGEEKVEKARVFRYTAYRIIRSRYKDFYPSGN